MSSPLKSLFGVLAFGYITCAAWAHPGAGIVVMPNGDVCYTSGNAILRVDKAGDIKTVLADSRNERFYQLHHLFIDDHGNLYTAADTGSGIWKVTPDGSLTRCYPPPNEDRSIQVGLGGDPFCIDDKLNVWAVNSKQNKFSQILKIDRDGRIVMVLGGDWGHADGEARQVKFGELHGSSFILGRDGSLYLTDDGRFVRRISPRGEVSTIAGNSRAGFADGAGARFQGAAGLALDGAGAVYVADSGNNRIRKIAAHGVVTTFAGTGSEGSADGPRGSATFQEPTGVTLDAQGAVYVLEAAQGRIRKIEPTGEVKTITTRHANRR